MLYTETILRPEDIGPPPRTSSLAVLAYLMSLLVGTSISAAGFVVALLAQLVIMQNSRLRGQNLIRAAIFLGGLSLWLQIWQCPIALLQPPVTRDERLLETRLQQLADGEFDDAYDDADWNVGEDVRRREFNAWAEDFSDRHGKCTFMWGKKKSIWNDYQAEYYIWFENSGMHTITVRADVDRKCYKLESIDGEPVALNGN